MLAKTLLVLCLVVVSIDVGCIRSRLDAPGVSGKVVTAADSKPIGGIPVIVTIDDRKHSTTTSSNGVFTVKPRRHLTLWVMGDWAYPAVPVEVAFDDFQPLRLNAAEATALAAGDLIRLGVLSVEADGSISLGQPSQSLPVPQGVLGYPLGTYLMLQGSRETSNYRANEGLDLRITAINARPLASPITIRLQNLVEHELPPHEMITVRGYETGRMVGIPDEVIDKEHIPPFTSSGLAFRTAFVVTSVVSLPSLEAEPLP